MSKLAEKIARLAGTNSKAAWKAVHKCKLGNKINHKKTKTMALKLSNGQRAKTDKENMSVFALTASESLITTELYCQKP